MTEKKDPTRTQWIASLDYGEPPTRDKTVAQPLPRTSASGLGRRYLCPGSARMEAGLPDEESEFGREATLLHRYATDPALDRAFLKPNQRDLLSRADELLAEVLGRLAFDPTGEIHIEQPLVTRDGRLPGRPDNAFHWPEGKTLLINEFKFGYNLVDRAELNLQLRGYAVLGYDNYQPTAMVYVSIVQPRAPYGERISLARYETEHIEKARAQINRILDESEKPDAPLRAGEEQCQYCRAKLICPAFRAAMTTGIAPFEPSGDLTKAAREAWVEERLGSCSHPDLERVYNAVRFAGFIKNAVQDEMRKRIERGDMAGYVLGKPTDSRKIANVRRAIALLSLSKISNREQLLDLCSMPIGDVEEIYRKATGATWKDTRDKINKILESVIETEERLPKIIRK